MEILIQLAPMLVVLVVFYLLLLLPEKKRKKEYQAMIEGLAVNDKVMTRGGIIGTIISLEEDEMVLESGPDRARLRFSKNAIANKIYKED